MAGNRLLGRKIGDQFCQIPLTNGFRSINKASARSLFIAPNACSKSSRSVLSIWALQLLTLHGIEGARPSSRAAGLALDPALWIRIVVESKGQRRGIACGIISLSSSSRFPHQLGGKVGQSRDVSTRSRVRLSIKPGANRVTLLLVTIGIVCVAFLAASVGRRGLL